MAQKDLIIGGCTNYGINQLKPWILSVNETMPDADKVMCVGNASPETRNWLSEQGFDIVNMPNMNVPIHVLRFLSIYDYLRKNWEKYRYVVTTDVKDVFFQSSPFKWMEDNFINGTDELVAGSEGMRYCDEPWGNDNLMQAYGPYVHQQFKDNTIYNVGVLGGTSEYMKDLVFNIFTNAINRPIPIVDQAVFNVLINTQPFKEVVAKTIDWAAELGTIMDPSKIEQFRPNLLYREPTFEDSLVKYGNVCYPIVHQYDRVPVLKKFVQEKYGQEDESQYFIYRT